MEFYEFYDKQRNKIRYFSNCKSCMMEYYRTDEYKARKRKESQTLNGRYKSYKSSAKQFGRIFLLTKEQFKMFWKKPCYYCNSPIETIGLDRLNNTLGYTMNNIVPCCWRCNTLKGIMEYKIRKHGKNIEKIVKTILAHI